MMNDHRVRLKQHCPAMDATPLGVDLERVISGMYPLTILREFETWLSFDPLSAFQICDRCKMSFFTQD